MHDLTRSVMELRGLMGENTVKAKGQYSWIQLRRFPVRWGFRYYVAEVNFSLFINECTYYKEQQSLS